MISHPKISVLIPNRNHSKYLSTAIESVLNQTFQDFELIIIDNASTDDSRKVIECYSKKDSRIIAIYNKNNIGMAENWNKCILYAKGEYIKFLNSDDFLEKSNLEELLYILETNLSISIVTSWKKLFGEKNNTIWQPFQGQLLGEDAINDTIRKGGNWIGEPTLIMFRKRDLYVGTFNISFNWLPDWDMWLRLLTIGDLYIVPKVLSNFRIHPDQETKILKSNFLTIFEEYYFSVYLSNHCKKYKIVRIEEFRKKKALKIVEKIPSFIKEKKYAYTLKVIRIIFNESIFLSSILTLLKKLIIKDSNKDLNKDLKVLIKKTNYNKKNKIVIYGFNDLAKLYYSKTIKKRNVIAIIDKNKKGLNYDNIVINDIENLSLINEKVTFIITARNKEFIQEIRNTLLEKYPDSNIINL